MDIRWQLGRWKSRVNKIGKAIQKAPPLFAINVPHGSNDCPPRDELTKGQSGSMTGPTYPSKDRLVIRVPTKDRPLRMRIRCTLGHRPATSHPTFWRLAMDRLNKLLIPRMLEPENKALEQQLGEWNSASWCARAMEAAAKTTVFVRPLRAVEDSLETPRGRGRQD